jgi:glycosyltransferase involved in cell wall biosynthesis
MVLQILLLEINKIQKVNVVDNKKKIVICSDSLAKLTGLGKTALRIAKGFYDSDKYDVSYFVITGQDSDKTCLSLYGDNYSKFFDNLKIYNCQLNDQNKFKLFDDHLSQEKPDILFSLLDPWNLDQIQMSQYRDSFYWIAYCLFETPEYPENVMLPNMFLMDSPRKSVFQPLREANLVIPVTKMGGVILEEHSIPHTENIYLGIDFIDEFIGKFTKEEIFGKTNITNSDVLLMTVGRNSERKKLDKVLEAFACFLKYYKEKDKNYKLYVHTDFNESVTGTDLIGHAQKLGILDNLIFPINFIKNETMLDSDLYKRYSVCDAYISLSAGEGFCLPIVESLMHNKPVVYLNYGGHAEYTKSYGYPVKVESLYAARNIAMLWALPDIADAAKNIKEALTEKFSMSSVEYTKNKFDWNSVIIPKLIDVIEESFVEKDKIDFNIKRII